MNQVLVWCCACAGAGADAWLVQHPHLLRTHLLFHWQGQKSESHDIMSL